MMYVDIIMMDVCVCVPVVVAALATGVGSVSIWSVYYCNYLRLCACRHSVSSGDASLTMVAPFIPKYY